jgi:hypothetical protein
MNVNQTVQGLLDRVYDNTVLDGLTISETVTLARTPTVTATALVSSFSPVEITALAGSGVAIKVEDLRIAIRASETLTSMSTDDVIIRNNKRYRVIAIPKETKLGGTVYEWICQARR